MQYLPTAHRSTATYQLTLNRASNVVLALLLDSDVRMKKEIGRRSNSQEPAALLKLGAGVQIPDPESRLCVI